MEAVIYGGHRLSVHLCLLYNLFIKCGFLCDSFMQSTMIPLFKNKCGDLSDLNNYRAIAMSSALSKTLHCVSKNDTDVAHYDFDADKPILIIFGRDVAKRVCYQTLICYPTSSTNVSVLPGET